MTKYRAQPVEIDGIRFASKKEGRRYKELCLRKIAGEIDALELQPSYQIILNDRKICKYIADFRYQDKVLGREVIEDVKGVRTPLYKLKKKLVEAQYNIEVSEI